MKTKQRKQKRSMWKSIWTLRKEHAKKLGYSNTGKDWWKNIPDMDKDLIERLRNPNPKKDRPKKIETDHLLPAGAIVAEQVDTDANRVIFLKERNENLSVEVIDLRNKNISLQEKVEHLEEQVRNGREKEFQMLRDFHTAVMQLIIN